MFPKNETPLFEMTVPSTEQKVIFRPFLEKERKSLLLAAAGSESEMILAMKAAVAACTFNKLEMTNMPNFDLESIFLKIRSKSIGESMELILTCNHCKKKDEYVLDINDVNVVHHEGHSKKIMLSDKLGVFMRYPTTEQLTELTLNYSIDTVFNVILDCIETVFDDMTVTNTADEPREELIKFVDTFTGEQMDRIEQFFKTMPTLEHTIKHNCSACGKENTYLMKGIENFFV